MKSIQIGEPCPDVVLTTQEGRTLLLSDFRGKQAVVLFFYPKDHTPICTKQACSFRDTYESFVEAGAAVLGVSGDSAASHQSFIDAKHLPYVLVADVDGAVRRAFGVHKAIGLFPRRVTYVIDREGIVRHICRSQILASKHVAEALHAVRELSRTAHAV